MSKDRSTDRHRKGYYKDYLRKWRAGLVGKRYKKEELEMDVAATRDKQIAELQEALKAALEWIDAVPASVAEQLPSMPGFDRDWAEGMLDTKAYRIFASEARSPAVGG